MEGLFAKRDKGVDTRKRRRIFRFVKKIERVSLVILVWLAGASILYGIYTVTFVKSYFDVENIEVKGDLRHLDERTVIELSGINIGDHLFRIPVREVQRRLVESPWVKEAAVHRKLPHLVLIYVNEYVPEAIVKKSGWKYVDKYGNDFKEVSVYDSRNMPVITGLDKYVAEESKNGFRSKILEMLQVKKIFETSLFGEVYGLSEIHYSESRGVSVITLNDPMELRLGFGPFSEKISRIEMVYPAIRSHGGAIAYVDLSPEGKVVVKYGT